jgi:hypothetical protein
MGISGILRRDYNKIFVNSGLPRERRKALEVKDSRDPLLPTFRLDTKSAVSSKVS